MTGSSLAPIVIPIVVTISLAVWLILVYHAASHPEWRRKAAHGQQNSRPVTLPGQRQPDAVSAPQRRAA